MKKLLILLSAVLLFVGCGSSPSTQTQQAAGPPSVSFVVSPIIVNQGEPTTLTWTTENATSVELSGFPDATSPTGVITDYPTATTAYTIRALGPMGISAPVTLTVTVIAVIMPPPPLPAPTHGVVALKITWDLPTVYTDGTLIEQAALDNLVTQIFMKTVDEPFLDTEIPIGTSAYRAFEMSILDVTVTLNQPYYFSARIHVAPDGLWSVFALTVPHTWSAPTP